ncbi:MAG: phage portal protein [Desulfobacterales bacterium]
MGVIAQLKNTSTHSASPKDPVIANWWGRSGLSNSGVSVTADTAMRVMAVYACVRIQAESVAMLPLNLYRKKKQDGRSVSSLADDLPLYRVLHARPNKWQTAFEWREMMQGHVSLRGNAYSEIVSAGANAVAELIPLHPDRVTPFQTPNNSIAYEYRPLDDEPRILLKNEMFHLRGLSSDGIIGIDPISLAREALGISIAAETFGATYFGNGTVIGGVLEHPGALGDKAYDRLKKSWEDRHQGAGRAHKPALLEEGMKWQSIGVEPEKAQFLETRKFQVTEIARMFRIPPHMIADLEHATFSNIEHQGIEFVTHSLMPWLIRWEQAISRDLISDAAARTVYPKFNVNSLLRGDTKARFEAYQMAAGGNAPWMSRNDIRELEDLNPEDGLDELLTPLNMASNNEPASDPEPDDTTNNRMAAMIQVSASRLARKESKVIAKYYERDSKDLVKFFENVSTFYALFVCEITDQLQISFEVASLFMDSGRQILMATAEGDIKELLDGWEASRTQELIRITGESNA